ncbi:hypothetical protein FHS54_001061 [Sphingobium vermicomposti]|uniref:Uncharacterized protein n=1 Tax=Sphingobium vermicomposti TaxID=529005 RepID=A0A846ME60_9SPHN|nr:hypothetical protein [Sphingobium vermicomposti]
MFAWILLVALLLPVVVGGISFCAAEVVSSRLNYFRGTAVFVIAFLPTPTVSWWLCGVIIKYLGNLSVGVPVEKTGGDGPAFMALVGLVSIWWFYSLLVGSIWTAIALNRHRRREAMRAVEEGGSSPVYGG